MLPLVTARDFSAWPSAVLFDLDGTLVDSRRDIASACNHVLARHGRTNLPLETISGFVGDGARALLARAFGAGTAEAELERALVEFRRYYEAHPADHTTLLPGVRETLAALAGVPLGIVTNKPRGVTLLVLERMGLAGEFQVVRAGGDGPLKPDPWPVLDALGELGVAPTHAWLVGDGAQDIGAGRAAACLTVAVRGGFGSDRALAEAAPDMTVDSLAEVAEFARRLRRLGRASQPGP